MMLFKFFLNASIIAVLCRFSNAQVGIEYDTTPFLSAPTDESVLDMEVVTRVQGIFAPGGAKAVDAMIPILFLFGTQFVHAQAGGSELKGERRLVREWLARPENFPCFPARLAEAAAGAAAALPDACVPAEAFFYLGSWWLSRPFIARAMTAGYDTPIRAFEPNQPGLLQLAYDRLAGKVCLPASDYA